MSESSNKKRLLYLLRYLQMFTNEEHPIGTSKLEEVLSEAGYEVKSKTIKNDVDTLIAAGYDVIIRKSTSNQYFYGNQMFEPSEIKLLIDMVSSSRAITEKQSADIISRLLKLTNQYEAEKLKKCCYGKKKIKAENEQMFYIIDIINRGIAEKKQISFQYYDYTSECEKVLKHNGAIYHVSPYTLLSNEDKYYMIGYSERRQDIAIFRVDRMCGADLSDFKYHEKPKHYKEADYTNGVFKMYPGIMERKVTIKCDSNLMKCIVDRFGTDIEITDQTEKDFITKIKVSVSPTFFSWVFQFAGKVKIEGPEDVREEYKKVLNENINLYL